jgi:CheY-like chemotaxis protein
VLYPLSYGGPGAQTVPAGRAYAGSVGNRPGRVLVVDDTANVRALIRVNLELEGLEVYVACDGQEALDKVASVAPDLITMDVMMPGMDGLAAASRLKSMPETAAIPIVMVTARAQAADRRAGRDAGVDAYVTKPFDPDELVATVLRLLPPGLRPEHGGPPGSSDGHGHHDLHGGGSPAPGG